MSRRVPIKDTDLIAYADAIMGGFKTDSHIFTNPPDTVEELTSLVNELNLAIDNVAINKSSYEAAITAKDINLKKLHKAIIAATEYCYRIAEDNKAILSSVGLTPRTEKRPTELPGQVRDLEVVK